MIKDNLLPITVCLAPPSTDDQAIQRIAELASDTLIGLTGAVFLDINQFTKAMIESRLNCRCEMLMDSGRVKTYKGTVIDPNGYEYKIILNAVGEYWLQVINVKLSKPGPLADPELVKEMQETLKE